MFGKSLNYWTIVAKNIANYGKSLDISRFLSSHFMKNTKHLYRIFRLLSQQKSESLPLGYDLVHTVFMSFLPSIQPNELRKSNSNNGRKLLPFSCFLLIFEALNNKSCDFSREARPPDSDSRFLVKFENRPN